MSTLSAPRLIDFLGAFATGILLTLMVWFNGTLAIFGSLGVTGAVTVMFSASAMNSALAISGTIALGLAGQMLFSLVADKWGLLGLPQRNPTLRDALALVLIITGSVLLVFFGGA